MKTEQKNKIDVQVKHPLEFTSSMGAEEYVYSLKLDQAEEFYKLISTTQMRLEKCRDFIYQEIRLSILESNEISTKKYEQMLKLMYKLGIGYRYKYIRECLCGQTYDCFAIPNGLEALKLSNIENLNNLIKIEQKNSLFSNGLVNKLNAFASVLINYSNFCSKKIFGKALDESLNIIEFPVSSIGKYINNNWDMKSCIDNLKNYLASCMYKNYKGNMDDLIKLIKNDYHSFSWIEAWFFSLTFDDAVRNWKRLSNV